MEVGGVSGAPVSKRSLEVLKRLNERVGAKVGLVSVGGISTPEQAWERIAAGASPRPGLDRAGRGQRAGVERTLNAPCCAAAQHYRAQPGGERPADQPERRGGHELSVGRDEAESDEHHGRD